MKKLFTVILLSLSITVYGQSWQQTGNTLQRRIVGSDTSYRFSLGFPGFMYLYTKPQIDALVQLRALKDSTFIKGKNLNDIPNATTARLNLGITPLLALKADDNTVVHRTGDLNESVNGIKAMVPNITVTANNQTFSVFTVIPVVNQGAFNAPTLNAQYLGVNVLASQFKGNDGTVFGSATASISTLGSANTLRIRTTGSGNQFPFEAGQTLGDTRIRPYHSESAITLGQDGGRVVVGVSTKDAIAPGGDVVVAGLSIDQGVQPQHNADTVIGLRIRPNLKTGNAIATYDTLVGGAGYTNGSYTNVLLINGTGAWARATVTVSGSSVTSVTITYGGAGYVVGDIVNFTSATIGSGGGLSASIRVATLAQYTGTIPRAIKSSSTAQSDFAGDIEVTTIGKGIILHSPDNTRYRITVANGGALTVTAL